MQSQKSKMQCASRFLHIASRFARVRRNAATHKQHFERAATSCRFPSGAPHFVGAICIHSRFPHRSAFGFVIRHSGHPSKNAFLTHFDMHQRFSSDSIRATNLIVHVEEQDEPLVSRRCAALDRSHGTHRSRSYVLPSMWLTDCVGHSCNFRRWTGRTVIIAT